ncbi:MAG: DUF3108 domain-containing protein [Candidatus Omnitrophica bacterium]|nr:DUF3108 domain-containing protein [Candidatus Omnitrophota bacterium]
MKFLKIAPILFPVFILTSCAGVKEEIAFTREDKTVLSAESISVSPPLTKFQVGEHATYEVRWVGIPVATITSTIKGIKKIDGRDAYFIEASARTNNWASLICRIDDRFRTYLDTEKLVPLRSEDRRSEGFYRKDAVTILDHEAGKAYFENYRDRSQKTFDIPSGLQDLLSTFYYMRTITYGVGDRVSLYVDFSERIYLIEGKIEKKVFLTIPRRGTYETVFTRPQASREGKTVKDGTAQAYFTVDERRAPLQFTVKAPLFTSLTATLVKVEVLDSEGLACLDKEKR